MQNKSERKLKWIESPWMFFGMMLFYVISLFTTRFFPSGDGPAHLYNANLLLHLIKGDEVLAQYFEMNTRLIANWPSHLILSFFLVILPAWIAEKALLIIYVIGISLSFRYLVSVTNPYNKSMSLIIFPFIHTFLLHSGFWNFSLSIIFLFLTPAIFFKRYFTDQKVPLLWITLLLTLSAITNILVFFIIGLIIGLWIIHAAWIRYNSEGYSGSLMLKFFSDLGLILLAALPSLILVIMFLNSSSFYDAEATINISERLKWLVDARPFIIYWYVEEEVFTQMYVVLLIFIVAFSLNKLSDPTESEKTRLKLVNTILAPLAVITFLFLTTPANSGAGMMEARYALLLFYVLIFWIATRGISGASVRLCVIILLTISSVNHIIHHKKGQSMLDKRARSIYESAEHIDPYSLVLPVDLTEHYLMEHFSNYLGVETPLIILENYEALLGWFPVMWRHERVPTFYVGDKSELESLKWIPGSVDGGNQTIDYVFIYGDMSLLETEKWNELQDILRKFYHLVYASEKDRERVYQYQHVPTFQDPI